MAWVGNFSWLNHLALHEERLGGYLNSTEDYLTFLCGSRRSHLFLPMALVYSVIFIVGVVGNFLVCLVILKHRNMKTPTNYYLFSLAVSDLLVLLFGMPLEVYEMWSNYPFLFGPVGCYLKTALFETVCFASILSVTTLSVERYIAILHPFRAKLESTRRRALRTIVALWALSVLFALPNTSTRHCAAAFPQRHPGPRLCHLHCGHAPLDLQLYCPDHLFPLLCAAHGGDKCAVLSDGAKSKSYSNSAQCFLGSFLCVCVYMWLLSDFCTSFSPISFLPNTAKSVSNL